MVIKIRTFLKDVGARQSSECDRDLEKSETFRLVPHAGN